MRNRRYRVPGNKLVLHITNRTIAGLPFRCSKYMEVLILGALAKAQSRFYVNICHFQWMGNHYHLIVSGHAKNISSFMNILDGELAKYLKRLYPGLFQSKVWESRFKEQVLHTANDVKRKIVYLYANPSRADLETSIDRWPGVTSWKMYKNGSHTVEANYIKPSGIRRPISYKLGAVAEYRFIKKLTSLYGESHRLVLCPNAWKKCFKDSSSVSDQTIFNDIETLLRESEASSANSRTKPVIGRKRLKALDHRPQYRPKERSPTPYVICHDKELRKQFIERYRYFCSQCRLAWGAWSKGLISNAHFPKGAYRPGMNTVAIRI